MVPAGELLRTTEWRGIIPPTSDVWWRIPTLDEAAIALHDVRIERMEFRWKATCDLHLLATAPKGYAFELIFENVSDVQLEVQDDPRSRPVEYAGQVGGTSAASPDWYRLDTIDFSVAFTSSGQRLLLLEEGEWPSVDELC